MREVCLFLTLLGIPFYSLATLIEFDANVEDLFAVLKKEKVTNLIQAVNLLDKQFFDTNQYALFFNSRSIQPSSSKFPRVLLFGKNKKLRLGFNHHMGKKRNLDILQYRELEKRWELREIKIANNKASLSNKNPGMCISCHGDRAIVPHFKGYLVESLSNKLSSYTKTQKKINFNEFRKIQNSDPMYSRSKELSNYLGGIGL